MPAPLDPNLPFRWDVRRDRLGSLLDGVPEPRLWFAGKLIVCAGRIVARSDDGDIRFVGRSLDSAFDLLGAALSSTSWRDRVGQIPFSLRYGAENVKRRDVDQLRANLTELGLAPASLARGPRPLVLVDLVAEGNTFGNLYGILRDWIDEEGAQWDVIRKKLRFVGVVSRRRTSPNTWRWQQAAPWTSELPASAIKNVSLDPAAWSYFGNTQPKLASSWTLARWTNESAREPLRDETARHALAEEVAIVELGRSREGRAALAHTLSREHAFKQPWLRSLALELRR